MLFGLIKSPSLAGMNTLIGYDLVPEPKILEAALRACRRLNDLASAIRILEAVKVRNQPKTFQRHCQLLIFLNHAVYVLRIKQGLIRRSTRTLSRS